MSDTVEATDPEAMEPAPKEPTQHWRVSFLVFAAALVAVTVIQAVSGIYERRDDRADNERGDQQRTRVINELELAREDLNRVTAQLELRDAFDTCRDRVLDDLDDAEVERHLADDAVTISIGVSAGVELPPPPPVVHVQELPDALVRLAEAERSLQEAQNARVAYTEDPLGQCPEAQAAIQAADERRIEAEQRAAEFEETIGE